MAQTYMHAPRMNDWGKVQVKFLKAQALSNRGAKISTVNVDDNNLAKQIFTIQTPFALHKKFFL